MFDSTPLIASFNQRRHPSRSKRARIDECVQARAFGQTLAVSLDDVLAAEASATNIKNTRPDSQLVVEAGGSEVANVYLYHRRLDSLVAERLVTAGVLREVGDAGGLEPDEVGGVVGDSGRVGLGEADGHLGEEMERQDVGTLGPIRLGM